MKKSLIVLAVLFLTTGLIAQTKASDKTKEDRWQGTIVRINQSESTLDVRGGQKNMDATDKRIHYDTSTEWTKAGKPADMKEFKDGSFVIALGHNDEKGVFHATRIDLRLPR
jgi:hypothetical protein